MPAPLPPPALGRNSGEPSASLPASPARPDGPLAPDSESLLSPLTFADHVGGIDTLSTLVGWVVPRRSGEEVFDMEGLGRALWGVGEKWRVLAGRVEVDKSYKGKGTHWGIRVPLGPLPADHPVAALTQSSHAEPFPSPLASATYDPTRFQAFDPPPRALFSHPKAATTMAALAQQQAPLLALHVATFSDTFAIGLDAPHGLFDGVAVGVILRALQAELAGQSWTHPPVGDLNPVQAGVDKLLEREGAVRPAWRWAEWAAGVWVVLGLIVTVVVGLVKGVKTKGVFIGDALLEDVVRVAKEEVKSEGEGEYVSTEDVVKLWFVKAAYAAEPTNTDTVIVGGNLGMRATLSAALGSDLSDYPHNAFCWYAQTPFPTASTLATAPLAPLALAHRRSILAARHPHNLAATLRHLQKRGYDFLIPPGWVKPDWWHIASQSAAGFGRTVDWARLIAGRAGESVDGGTGAEYGRVWQWIETKGLPGVMSLNRVEGGWVMIGGMRATRWESVERALRELEEEAAERQQ